MTLNYNKALEVRYEADVLVAGGGPAGIAAAVMAAEAGARVILIEQSGSFGGAGTLGMVPEIMNFDDGENFLCGGFGRRVHDALFPPCKFIREWMIASPEVTKRLYDKMIEEAGVTYLFFNKLTDAVTEGGRITHVIVSAPEGVYAIKAKYFIDTTGNGALSALAGCTFEYGDVNGICMPATLCSLWGNVDFDALDIEQQREGVEKAFHDGVLSQYDTILPGMKPIFPECQVAGGNIGHAFAVNDTESRSISDAMVLSRKILAEYERYYKNYVIGCENATLLRSADVLGIRESRRVHTDKTLTQEAFFAKEPFADEIGRYSYPVDIHPMTADAEGMENFEKSIQLRHGKGENYSIPYGAIVAKDMDNLFVAGRSIGADRAMQASVRVIPGAYITGQAAGIAAALCAKAECDAHSLDVKELQKKLKQAGAYLCI